MKKKIYSLCFILLCAFQMQAQILDQSNTAGVGSGWLVNNGSYTNVGQSFTAGISGDLAQVTINVTVDNPVYPAIAGTFNLIVRDGDGHNGTILATESFVINGSTTNGDLNIPVSTVVALTAGNIYTFFIDEVSGTGQIMINASGNTYASGSFYYTLFGTNQYSDPNYDMIFKTFMMTPDTYSTINLTSCGPYTSPSGNYVWNTSGTYQDTIPNTSGNDSIMTFNIVVNTVLDQNLSATDLSVCPGENTMINVASTQTETYYYLRDNSNGNVLGMAAGNGSGISLNTGAINSTATFDVLAVKYPKSVIDLPQSNDYIGFDNPFYTYNSALTIEAYVFFDGIENPKAGQSTPAADNMSTNVWLWEGGSFYVNDGGSWRNVAFPAIPNGWTHVSTVADATGLYIYYDGSLVASNSNGIVNGILNNPNSEIHFGHDPRFAPGTPGRNTNNSFDNLKIWDKARTQSEILSDMQQCLNGDETNLVHYTKFNEGIGSRAVSITGPDGQVFNQTSVNWSYGPGFCIDLCTMQMSDLITVSTAETYSTMNLTECFEYTVPSGNNTFNTDGTYMDTIQNAAGCDSIITINLTINTVDITTSVNLVTITANTSGASYQWINCDNGNSISGETGQSFTATSNGNYAVIVTQNGCSDTSACVNINSVGITETHENNFLIYPNPSNGIFNIQSQGKLSFDLNITDAAGRVVMINSNSNGSTTIDLSSMETGIYFVNMQDENTVKTIRVILQK